MNTIGMKIDEVRIDGCLDKFLSDLEQMQDMGIRAVELPVHGLDVILNGRLWQRRMDEVSAILQDFKFQYSVHAPNPVNLMDKHDPGLHADVLAASLGFARNVGAGVVVYHGGRYIPEEAFNMGGPRDLPRAEKASMREAEALVLQSISKSCPDVCIAVENARPYTGQSPYTYAESIDALRTQVSDVNRPNVGINLDFGHLGMTASFYGFDILDAVEKIRSLVVHTHIHDNFGGVVHHYEKQQTHQLPFGRGDNHMPVGWGTLPIREMLAIILPRYKGLLMMELRSRYFDYITESRDNLNALLENIADNKD